VPSLVKYPVDENRGQFISQPSKMSLTTGNLSVDGSSLTKLTNEVHALDRSGFFRHSETNTVKVQISKLRLEYLEEA
jgi:hypothetical protein